MECREIQEKISAYMDGELAEGERGTVARHLQGCPTCRRLEGELRGIAAEIAALPRRKAPPSIAQAVAREINASAETKAIRFPRRRTIEWVVAAAALLLVAVNVVFVWRAHEAEEGQPVLEKQRETRSKSPVVDTERRVGKSGLPERARELAGKSADDARGSNEAVAAAKAPEEQPKPEEPRPPEVIAKGGRFGDESEEKTNEKLFKEAPPADPMESERAKAESDEQRDRLAQQADRPAEKPMAPAKSDVETITIATADVEKSSSALALVARELGLPRPDPVASDKSDEFRNLKTGEKKQRDDLKEASERLFAVSCTEDQLARLLEGLKMGKDGDFAFAAKAKEAENKEEQRAPAAADSGESFKKAMPSSEGATAPGAAVQQRAEQNDKSLRYGGGSGGRGASRVYLIRIVKETPPVDQR